MLNDPKYTIKDGSLWHIAGEYFVPEEEPVFVMRGKDPIALLAMQSYIDNAADESHAQSMRERLDAFRAYQQKYPARTRVGCHMHKQGE